MYISGNFNRFESVILVFSKIRHLLQGASFYSQFVLVVALLLAGCSSHVEPAADAPHSRSVNLACNFSASSLGTPAAGLCVGLYGDVDGLFYASNLGYTLADGVLIPIATSLLYPVSGSAALCAYAPMVATVVDTGGKISFSVATDQSGGMASSDLLWGAATITRGNQGESLTLHHRMASVVVDLTSQMGNSLATATVTLKGVNRTCRLDLRTGATDNPSDPSTITTFIDGARFRALIPPQRFTAGGVITVTIGGRSYNYPLPVGKSLVSGDEYVFTLTVKDKPVYRPDGTVRCLMETPGRKTYLDIAIVGDGFTAEDNAVGGAFDQAAQKIVDFIFSIEPFKGYKECFRIYLVYANSTDRGAGSSSTDYSKNTKFGAHYGQNGVERLLVVRNTALAAQYAGKSWTDNTFKTMPFVLVNDERYGGSGGQIITASVNKNSPEISLHEICHGFNLADEYGDRVVAAGSNINDAKKYPNTDLTSDPSMVKWKHFIGLSGYEIEGVYEGGYYFATGVWRPSRRSLMHSLTSHYLNAASREEIVKYLYMNILKANYSLEKFLQRDVPPEVPVSTRGVLPELPMLPAPETYHDAVYGVPFRPF